jgi:predicted dehydrogenase
MIMNRKVKVGLVGFGMAGKYFHAPFLHTMAGFDLQSIVERSKEESKEHYPYAHIVRSVEELLAEEDIELIVIASPNDTHFEYARQALLSGKHVVIDKPFTITAKEGEELIALSEKHHKVLTVFQNRRWDGDFLTVRKLIQEGTLGEIQEYHANFDRFRPTIRTDSWKEAAGILYDLGPHLLDQAFVLFGKPQKVKSDIQKQREGAPADDFFSIALDYPWGCATLSAGMLVENIGPHFKVKGSKGSFIKYGMDPQENRLKAGDMPVGDHWGEDEVEKYGVLETELGKISIATEKGTYPVFYENVYQAIVKGEKLRVDPREALEVIRIIEQAKMGSK